MSLFISAENPTAEKIQEAIKSEESQQEIQNLYDRIYRLESQIETVISAFTEEIEELKTVTQSGALHYVR